MEAYGKNGSNVISFGPWGGESGFHWDDSAHSTVRQLEISHGAGIDSIRIEYDHKGTSVWSDKHGGSGGIKTDTVKLEPDEYLTSIHGSYGTLSEWGPTLVRSLTFESNKATYGPYGIEQGTNFSFPMIGGKIVGFHGMCGWYLDAIGVHFQLIHKQVPSKAVAQYTQNSYSTNTDEKLGYYVQREYVNVYNIYLARQTEDYNAYVPINGSRQNPHSHDQLTSTEPKSKIHALPLAMEKPPSEVAITPTIERVPSNTAAQPTIERLPSNNIKGVMTYGPWGGTGGSVFDDGIYDGIRQIKLSRNVGGMGGGIVSLQVCYAKNEYGIWGGKHGGTIGFKPEKINFDYPEEVLTHVTGCYGPKMVMGPTIIRSLTFHTNKHTYGPYGEEQGQSFSTKLREGAIVGLHGRKGLFLDAIGVHVIEGKIAIPAKISSSSSKSNNKHESPESSSKHQVSKSVVENSSSWPFKIGKRQEAEERVVKDPAPFGSGPWGGDGGKSWDDGVFTGIKQIILTVGEVSCAIEIEYDQNGQSVWSIKHGGSGGSMRGQTPQRVKLEYPDEVITCVSGYYGAISNSESMKVVKSLTFQTSRRRKFGPYGEELGTYFTSGTTEGKVVGFHGRSGMYLDAIGIHMQHWLGNHKPKSSFSSLAKFFY